MPDVEAVSVYLSLAGFGVIGASMYGFAGLILHRAMQSGDPEEMLVAVFCIGALLLLTGIAIYNVLGVGEHA